MSAKSLAEFLRGTDLKRHGDLGLGTFNTLDGEMVEVDNHPGVPGVEYGPADRPGLLSRRSVYELAGVE